jgi:hypothetical protein
MRVVIFPNTFVLSLSFNPSRLQQDINLLKFSCKVCIFSAHAHRQGERNMKLLLFAVVLRTGQYSFHVPRDIFVFRKKNINQFYLTSLVFRFTLITLHLNCQVKETRKVNNNELT